MNCNLEAKKLRKGFNDGITKNLLRMSIPTMMGFLFQSAYDLVDIIWIGKISASAVAAATIFTTIFWIVDILNEIIGASSVSFISQCYGSGDNDKTARAIEQTLIFKTIVAIIAAIVVMAVLKPLTGLFTTDEIVRKSALSYGYIRIFFLPVMFSSFTINTAFRCIGDAKKPMFVMLIAAICNIILDPIFMFDYIPKTHIHGFNMGIFGAGLATVISTTIAFISAITIFIIQEKHIKLDFKRMLKLDLNVGKKLITVGIPSGFQMLSKNLASIIVLRFISFYGTAAVAAMGIGNKLFNFVYMPIVGLSMGASAIVGQCLGNNDLKRAITTSKKAAILGVISMTLISIIVMLFPRFIIGLFINDANVIKVGIPMVRIVILGLIALGVLMGLASVFSGSGYNLPLFIGSLISRWIVQIPALFISIKIMKVNLALLWVIFVMADIVEMSVGIIFYKKGKWKTSRV